MKKNLRSLLRLSLGLFALAALPLLSCSDEKSEPIVDLSLSQTAASVKVGGVTSEVEIISGNGDYKVTSSDDNICIPTVSGSTLSLRGVAEGDATVTVTDAGGKAASLSVTVSATVDPVRIKLDRYTASMEKWDRDRLRLEGGNGDYTFTYDTPGIVEAAVIGGEVVVYGHAAGSATVTMTDGEGMTVDFMAIVSDRDLELKLKSNSAFVDVNTGRRIEIVSGNQGYKVVSSDESIATVTIEQDGESGPAEDAKYYVAIHPVSLGKIQVTLKDNTGSETFLNVEMIPYYFQELDFNENGYYIGYRVNPHKVEDPDGDYWYMVTDGAENLFDLTPLTEDLPEGQPLYLTMEYSGNERASTVLITLFKSPAAGNAGVLFQPLQQDGSIERLWWPAGSWWKYDQTKPKPTDETIFFGTNSFPP